MDLVINILSALTLVIFWQFLGYPIFSSLLVLKHKNESFKFENFPFVSILVATFNEETVIIDRLNNLIYLDYPQDKFEIIVIDSASTDKTVLLTENLINTLKDKSKIKIIQETKRSGKASALNLGVKHSQGEIILIADANSLFNKDILRFIIPLFKDLSVGAVSGRYIIKNIKNDLALSENFYWELENILFISESYLDSIATVCGTISAWRRKLAFFESDIISEDLDLCIRIRKSGFKVKYTSKAEAYEPAAANVKDQILQRRRTALGTIQCIQKHFLFLFKPTNLFSLLIFPSHKILPILSPWILITILFIYFIKPEIIIFHFLISIFLFTILFSLFLIIKPRSDTKKAKFSVLLLPKLFYYVILNEMIVLFAWFDFIFKNKSIIWEKAISTRIQ